MTSVDKEQDSNFTQSTGRANKERTLRKRTASTMEAGSSTKIARPSSSKKSKIDELACQKLKLANMGLRKKLEQQDRIQIEELLAQIKTLQASMENLSAEHEREKARMGKEVRLWPPGFYLRLLLPLLRVFGSYPRICSSK